MAKIDNKKIKILLIEDNPGDARLMQEALTEQKGVMFDLEWAESLKTGLEQIGKQSVDLVLLDLSLPDSQGLATFEQIQKHAQGIPVVVLTGLFDESLAMKALQQGAQDYLMKGQMGSELLVRSIRYAIERQRIEEELRKSNDFNASILKAMPFGMVIVDAQGDILYLSERFEAILGKETIGRKCWLVYRDDNTQCYECPLKSEIKIGQVKSIEAENIMGGKIYQIMHIGIMYEGRKAVLEIFNDITERKHIDQMKSDFVALVSHQLKTPVGELSGYIDNMLNGLTGELFGKQKQYLLEMREINSRAYRLITDLLNVSRIERGVISVNLQAVKLQEILTLALRDYLQDISKKGLSLNLENMDQEITVMTDKDKTVEAVSNVISNAVRFTEQGSIVISLRSDDFFGYIDIQDTGKGVLPELLDKLFKREQTLSGCPRPEGGAGLGLYIAKNFMVLQQGDVWVESTGEQGSKFIFRIPIVMV